jgi:2-amino-4-hydroxy-6-hydroxymethyldihydropteridine diphosphokinase
MSSSLFGGQESKLSERERPEDAKRVFLGMGSNLGNRREHLDKALELLGDQPGVTIQQVSSRYETTPVGGPPGQGMYLNCVAEIETDLAPEELLGVLHETEQNMGRVRKEPNEARIIDLDLLLYGNLVFQSDKLTLPHPRMHERLFVLEPLAEIAPEVIHPVLRRSLGELFNDLAQKEGGMTGDLGGQSRLPALRREEAPGSTAQRDLKGKKAVITGSTSGIGKAIALALAAAGADIVVHGREEDQANEVAEAVEGNAVESMVVLADLADRRECRRMVKAIWKEWGPIDIWINNAGADVLTGEAILWPYGRKLNALWLVDVRATIMLAREVGQRMQREGKGVILNMGWDKADSGMAGDSGELFAATKGAVMAYTKSLALSLAPQVRINCLAPGWIKTAWGENASEAWQEYVVGETPLERWGTPDDVAQAARWLVSPAAAFITGQVIRINGGVVT